MPSGDLFLRQLTAEARARAIKDRSANDPLDLARASRELAAIALIQGRLAQAEREIGQALRYYRREDRAIGEADALKLRAEIERREGRLARAEADLRAALRLYLRVQHAPGVADTLMKIGDVLRDRQVGASVGGRQDLHRVGGRGRVLRRPRNPPIVPQWRGHSFPVGQHRDGHLPSGVDRFVVERGFSHPGRHAHVGLP